MAVTNWVNEASAVVTMDDASPAGGAISKGTVAKSATASDAAVQITFTAPDTGGPASVYVAETGTGEVTAAAPSNAVLIGTHTPVTAAAQVSNEFNVSQAFGGRLPDSWDIWVLNGMTGEITDLVVNSIQGHYVTT
jgi:hypothetical protein